MSSIQDVAHGRVKLKGNVSYAVVILLANFHLLPQNPSCPKTPVFKKSHGLRGLQVACKQRKRHVTLSKIASLYALLQLFSITARYNSQILICPFQNWVSHPSKTRLTSLNSTQCQPRLPLQAQPIAQLKRRGAVRNNPIRWAITLPFFLQNSPNSQEMSSMQSSSCMTIFTIFPQILLVQNHQRLRRDMDTAVLKLPASRGRVTWLAKT